MLERHKLDCSKLWITQPPEEFRFLEQNSSQIKTIE